jgi:flagellar motor switch protein FliM
MEKILSKEEIDALLAEVFEGKVEPERELAHSGQASAYDIFSSESYRGYVPNLDLIYDSFIRYNRVTMSNRLRRLVELHKGESTSQKFDEYLHALPSMVCMAIVKIDPLKGAALITFDTNLVFAVVDSILGGSGETTTLGKNRSFTSIELRIMEKLVKDALNDLEKAWAPLFATKMSILRMEVNPRLVNIVPPEYQVVSTSLEIEMENFRGSMMITLPFMTIEPIRDKLKAGSQFDMMAIDPQWSSRLSEELVEAPLEISVELGNSTITMDELLELTSGDTIMLDKACTGELLLKVAGIPKFRGLPGVRHGNKAIQITSVIEAGGNP